MIISVIHLFFTVSLGAVEHAAKTKQQQQQQQLRSETPSQPLSRPPSSRSHHQAQQQIDSPVDTHPPFSSNQSQTSSQPHPPHQQHSLDQPPNWKPEEPRGYAIGGNPSLAAMIAARAANRKPMVTSPTKKENIDQTVSSAQPQTTGYNSYQEHQVCAIFLLLMMASWSSVFIMGTVCGCVLIVE